MSNHDNDSAAPKQQSWRARLARAFLFTPSNSEELLEVLQEARENHLLDNEAFQIMEGALSVGDTQVDEIMIPRSQMIVLREEQDMEALLKIIIDSGHSRFPVLGESSDDVKGILLAKSLLPFLLKRPGKSSKAAINLQQLMHPAHIVPETKRLNDLLKEFREKRYHMAIVVDEYGGVSGLVTIEDILEEIVGEIEDETDEVADDEYIRKLNNKDYLVKALTPIALFNEQFGADFSDEEYDTIGGLLMQQFGHLPRRNEITALGNFRFRVLNADKRQIHLLRVSALDAQASA